MPMQIITTTQGQVVGVRTWAEGFKPLRVPTRISEDDILARCLWLINHKRVEEAEILLDSYTSR